MMDLSSLREGFDDRRISVGVARSFTGPTRPGPFRMTGGWPNKAWAVQDDRGWPNKAWAVQDDRGLAQPKAWGVQDDNVMDLSSLREGFDDRRISVGVARSFTGPTRPGPFRMTM